MSKRVNNKKGKKFSPSRGSNVDKPIDWSGFDFSNPSKIDSNDIDRLVSKSVDSTKPTTSKSAGRGR